MAGGGAASTMPVAVADRAGARKHAKGSVDVLAFPSPLWHEMDGGRYIGTGCSVVTRDLDSDWVNVGTYRVQVIDRNHVALDMVPGKHGRIHYEKHKEAGKRFPVAIVLRRRSARLPHLGHRDSVRHVRVELHRRDPAASPSRWLHGEMTGLPFPAASEIVLEGFVEPNDERTEGPVRRVPRLLPGQGGHRPGRDGRAGLLPERTRSSWAARRPSRRTTTRTRRR